MLQLLRLCLRHRRSCLVRLLLLLATFCTTVSSLGTNYSGALTLLQSTAADSRIWSFVNVTTTTTTTRTDLPSISNIALPDGTPEPPPLASGAYARNRFAVASFSGGQEYIDLGAPAGSEGTGTNGNGLPPASTSGWSLSFWIYTAGLIQTTEQTESILLSCTTSSTSNPSDLVLTINTAGQLQLKYPDNNMYPLFHTSISVRLFNLWHQWVHVVIVSDKIVGEIRTYLNGILSGQLDMNIGQFNILSAPYCYLGGRTTLKVWAKNMTPFRGSIYAMALFTNILTQSQIEYLAAPHDPLSTISSSTVYYNTWTSGLNSDHNSLLAYDLPWKDFLHLYIPQGQFLDLSTQTPSQLTSTAWGSISSSWTLAWWWKFNSIPGASGILFDFRDSAGTFICQVSIFTSAHQLVLAYGQTVALDTFIFADYSALTGLWSGANGRLLTEWNHFTLEYDSTQKSFISFINGQQYKTKARVNTFSTDVTTNQMYISKDQSQGAGAPTLDMSIVAFAMWMNQALNKDEVYDLAEPHQQTFTHDAPKTVVAGTNVVITLRQVEQIRKNQQIIATVLTDSQTIIAAQYLTFEEGTSSIPISFAVPMTASTLTIQFSFSPIGSSTEVVLPQPICMEVVQMDMITDMNGYTLLTLQQYLSLSDFSYTPSSDWNPHSNGCNAIVGGSDLNGVMVASCTTAATENHIYLDSSSEISGVIFPQFTNPYAYSLSIWFQAFDTSLSPWLFSTASSMKTQANLISLQFTSNGKLTFVSQVSSELFCQTDAFKLYNVTAAPWWHVGVVLGNGGCSMYINGELQIDATNHTSYGSGWYTTSTSPTVVNRTFVKLGGSPKELPFSSMKGAFASFTLWNRALESREIAFLAANPPMNVALPTGTPERISINTVPTVEAVRSRAVYYMSFSHAPSDNAHGTILPAPSGLTGYSVLQMDGSSNTGISLLNPADTTEVGSTFPLRQWTTTSVSGRSMSLWYKYDGTLPTPAQPIILFQAKENSGSQNYWELRQTLQPGKFVFTISSIAYPQTLCVVQTQGTNLHVAGWNQIGAQWNGDTRECSLWWNGIKMAAATMMSGQQLTFVPIVVTIGSPGATATFAEFVYYERALTAQEMRVLAMNPPRSILAPAAVASTSSSTSPSFSPSAADVILGSSDYNFEPHAAITNLTLGVRADTSQLDAYRVLSLDGPITPRVQLNAAGQVETLMRRPFPYLSSATITVSLWIQRTDANTSGCLVSFSNINAGVPAADPISIEQLANVTRWSITSRGDSDNDVPTLVCSILTPANTLPVGVWSHIVGVLDEKDQCRLYINGSIAASAAAATVPLPGIYHRGVRQTFRSTAAIGKCGLTDSTRINYPVAQITIWQRGLNQLEVAALFSQPPPSIARLVNPQLSNQAIQVNYQRTVPPPTVEWLFTKSGLNYASLNGSASISGGSTDYIDLTITGDNPSNTTSMQTMPYIGGSTASTTINMWFQLPQTAPSVPLRLFECSQANPGNNLVGLNALIVDVLYDLSVQAGHSVVNDNGAAVLVRAQTDTKVIKTGPNQWSMVTVVWNVDEKSTRVYINSALLAFVTWSYPPLLTSRPICTLTMGLDKLQTRVNINVASFAYWNSALTPKQMVLLYNSPPIAALIIKKSRLGRLFSSAVSSFAFLSDPGLTDPLAPTFIGKTLDFSGSKFYYINLTQFVNTGFGQAWPTTLFTNQLTDGLTITMWIRWSNAVITYPIRFFDCSSSVVGTSSSSFSIETTDEMPDARLRLISRNPKTGVICAITFDSYYIQRDASWHHYTFVLANDNLAQLYVDGILRPNVNAVSTCVNQPQLTAQVLSVPLFSTGSRDKCQFGGLGASAGYNSLAARLAMLQYYSRVLVQSEIDLLATALPFSDIDPSFNPNVPAKSDVLSTATYLWKFESITNDTLLPFTLVPAPNGVGTIGALNGTKSMLNLLADNGVDYSHLSVGSSFPNPYAAIAIWVKWLGIDNADGTNPTGGAVPLALLDLATADRSGRIIIQVLPSIVGVTGSYLYKISFKSAADTFNFTTQPGSVKVGEWQHLVLTMEADYHRVYLDGSLSSLASGSFACFPQLFLIGQNIDTPTKVALQLASVAIWDNIATPIYADTVTRLYLNPPPNIAGLLGSPAEQLLRSVTGLYLCSAPQSNLTSQVTVGWSAGDTPGTGICEFNGFPGPAGSYLDLNNPSNAELVLPQVTSNPIFVGENAGMTFSFHFTMSTVLTVEQILFSCAGSENELQGSLLVRLIPNTNQQFQIQFWIYSISQTPLLKILSIPLMYSQYPPGSMLHLMVIGGKIPLSSVQLWTMYLQNQFLNSITQSVSMPRLPRDACFIGKTSLSPTRQGNFAGTLGRFALWQRVLSPSEMFLVQTNPPEAYVPANRIMTPKHVNTVMVKESLVLTTTSRSISTCANRRVTTRQNPLLILTSLQTSMQYTCPLTQTYSMYTSKQSFTCAALPYELSSGWYTTSLAYSSTLPVSVGMSSLITLVSPHAVSLPTTVSSSSSSFIYIAESSDITTIYKLASASWPFNTPLFAPSGVLLRNVGTYYYILINSITPGSGGDGFNLFASFQNPPNAVLPSTLFSCSDISHACGFMAGGWISLDRQRRPNDVVFQISTANGNYRIAFTHVSDSPVYSLYQFQIISNLLIKCTLNIELEESGSWTHLMLRYTHVQAQTPARISIHQNGRMIGQADCQGPLAAGTIYDIASLSSSPDLGHTMSVARWDVFPYSLSDTEISVLANVIPSSIIKTDWIIDAPSMISALNPVVDITFQPMRHDGVSLVELNIQETNGVYLSPTNRLQFLSSAPQTLRVTISPMVTSLTLTFTMNGTGAQYYNTPQPLCLNVYNPSQVLPFNQDPSTFLASSAQLILRPLVADNSTFARIYLSTSTPVALLLGGLTADPSPSASSVNLKSGSVLNSPLWPATSINLPLTLNLWFIQDGVANNAPEQQQDGIFILHMRSDSNGGDLRLSMSSGALTFSVVKGSPSFSCVVSTPSNNVVRGRPVMVTLTTDATLCSLSLNGVRVASAFSTGSGWSLLSPYYVIFGSSYGGMDADKYPYRFAGQFVNLAVFNTSLTESQVAALMQVVPAGLQKTFTSFQSLTSNIETILGTAIATYRFTSARTRNAPITLAQPYYPSALPSGYVTGDGARASISLTSAADQAYGQTLLNTVIFNAPVTTFSYVFWLRFDTLPVLDQSPIFECASDKLIENAIQVFTTTQKEIVFRLYMGAELQGEARTSTAAYSLGRWFSLVISQGDISQPTMLYINGQLAGQSVSSLYIPVATRDNNCYLMTSADRTRFTSMLVGYFAFRQSAIPSYQVELLATQPPASVYRGPVTAMLPPTRMYGECNGAGGGAYGIQAASDISTTLALTLDGNSTLLYDGDDSTYWYGSLTLSGKYLNLIFAFTKVQVISQIRLVQGGFAIDSSRMTDALRVHVLDPDTQLRIASFTPFKHSQTPFLYTLPKLIVKAGLSIMFEYPTSVSTLFQLNEISFYGPSCPYTPPILNMKHERLTCGSTPARMFFLPNVRSATSLVDASLVCPNYQLKDPFASTCTFTSSPLPLQLLTPVSISVGHTDTTSTALSTVINAPFDSVSGALSAPVGYTFVGTIEDLMSQAYARWSWPSDDGVKNAGVLQIRGYGIRTQLDMTRADNNPLGPSGQKVVPSTLTPPFTLHMLILIDSTPTIASSSVIFSMSVGTGPSKQVVQIQYEATNRFYVSWSDVNGTVGELRSNVIPQNVWMTFVLSIDAQGLMTLRIDGASGLPAQLTNYCTNQTTKLLSGTITTAGLGDILPQVPAQPVAQFNLASMQWFTRLLSENEQQMLLRNPPSPTYPFPFILSSVVPLYFTSTSQVIFLTVSLTRYIPGTTIRLQIFGSPGCAVSPGYMDFTSAESKALKITLLPTNGALPFLSVSITFSLQSGPTFDVLNYVAPDPLCFGVAERTSLSTGNAQSFFSTQQLPHLFVNFNRSIGPIPQTNVPLASDGTMTFTGQSYQYVDLTQLSDTRVTNDVNNTIMPQVTLSRGFSLMMWYRQNTQIASPSVIVDFSTSNPNALGNIRISTTPWLTNTFMISFGTQAPNQWSIETPQLFATSLQWVHIGITLSDSDPGIGQLLSVYVNGVIVMEKYAPIDLTVLLGSPIYSQYYIGQCTPASGGCTSPQISLASFSFLPSLVPAAVIASVAGELPSAVVPSIILSSGLSDVTVTPLESYSSFDSRQQVRFSSPSFQCTPRLTLLRATPGLFGCVLPIWNATQHTVTCDLIASPVYTLTNLSFRALLNEYVVPLTTPVSYQIVPTYYHAFQTLIVTVPSNPTTPLTYSPSLTSGEFRYNLIAPAGVDTMNLAFTFNMSVASGTPFRVRIDGVGVIDTVTPLSSVTLPPMTNGNHVIRFGSFELGTIVMYALINVGSLSYLKLSGVFLNRTIIPLSSSPDFSPATLSYQVQTSEVVNQLQFTYPIYGDDFILIDSTLVKRLSTDTNPFTFGIPILAGLSQLQLSLYNATSQDLITYIFSVNNTNADGTITPPSSGNGTIPVSAPIIAVAQQPVFYAGGVVVLRAVATIIDPLTVRSSLIWRWDAIGPLASLVNVSLFVYANATATTSTLVLNPAATQLLTIGQEYIVRVYATDSDPTHFLAGGSSAARAIGTTLVRFNVSKPIDLNVIGALEDPCTTTSNPCQNGGVCSAVRTSADGVVPIQWLMSCLCPVVPITFYGLTCSFALVGCPNCISKYRGNQTLTLLGIGLDATVGMTIGVGVGVGSGGSGGSGSSGSSGTGSGFKIDPLNLPYTIRGVDNQDVAIAIQSLQSVSNQFVDLTSLQAITFISPSLVKPILLNDSAVTTRRLLLSTRLLSQRRGTTSKQQQQQQHVSLEFDENNNDNDNDDDGSVTYIENPISAYQTLRVSVALPLATTLQSIDYTNLIFYASSQCLSIGEFIPDGEGGCLTCPDGGYCPGGGRVWPQSGYWSYGEYYKPLKCRIPIACIGIDPLLAGTSSDGTAPYFQQDQKCSPGYQGVRCGQCKDDYYQLNEQCAYCGSSTNQNAAITLTIIAAIVVVTILALGVAFLDAWHLARYVAIFCILQEIALVGVVASRDLPRYSKELSTFFTYFNLINFELEILRPGCAGVPSFTFVDKYWSTLLFMFFACIFFALTCLGRYMMKKSQWARLTKLHADRHKEEAEIQSKGVNGTLTQVQVYQAMTALPPLKPMPYFPPHEDLKHRLRHSWLILLSIFYLRMCILLFKSFKCEYAPNPILSTASNAVVTYSKYLSEDLQTECFVDGHLGIVIVSLILCMIYVIGFPVFCFVLLSRAFATEYESGITGWMYNKFACLHDDSSGGSGIVTFFAQTKMQWLHALRVEQKDEERRSQRVKQSTGGSAAVAMNPVVVSDDDIWTEYRESAFGFLYMYLRPEYFAACMRIYLANISFALITVFVDDDTKLKLFLFGLTSAIMTMSIAIQLPYDTTERNFRKVLIGCVALGHSGLMLAIQSSGPQSGYFAVLVIVLCVIAILLVFREKLPCLKQSLLEAKHQKHLKAMKQENRIGGEEDDDDDIGDYLSNDDDNAAKRSSSAVVAMSEISVVAHDDANAKLAPSGPSSSPQAKLILPPSSTAAAAGGGGGDIEMAPMSPSQGPAVTKHHPPPPVNFTRPTPSAAAAAAAAATTATTTTTTSTTSPNGNGHATNGNGNGNGHGHHHNNDEEEKNDHDRDQDPTEVPTPEPSPSSHPPATTTPHLPTAATTPPPTVAASSFSSSPPIAPSSPSVTIEHAQHDFSRDSIINNEI